MCIKSELIPWLVTRISSTFIWALIRVWGLFNWMLKPRLYRKMKSRKNSRTWTMSMIYSLWTMKYTLEVKMVQCYFWLKIDKIWKDTMLMARLFRVLDVSEEVGEMCWLYWQKKIQRCLSMDTKFSMSNSIL